MSEPQAPATEDRPDLATFRRGATWLRKTGLGHTGKKGKRLIHRRDRHESRNQLRNLSLI